MHHRLVVALVITAAIAACGPKKLSPEEKNAAARTEIGKILQDRRDTIVKSFPTDDKADGEHPWIGWIKRATIAPPTTEFEKIAVKYKDTPMAKHAKDLSEWMERQRLFYKHEQSVSVKELMRDIKNAQASLGDGTWREDLDFDELFAHAEKVMSMPRFFVLPDNAKDDRVTQLLTYWRYVWDFEPLTSLFEDEVNKLCKAKLPGVCDDVPMENRPFKVLKPYFEALAARCETFKKTHAQSAYNPIVDRLSKLFSDHAKRVDEAFKLPDYEVFPDLASIRSTRPAPIGGNALLVITQRGVAILDVPLRDPAKGWKPNGWKADKELAGEISKIVDEVRSSTASPYSQADITIVTEKPVTMDIIEPALRATIKGDKAKGWPRIVLTGRHRADGSMQRAGYRSVLLGKDLEGEAMVVNPENGKKLTCGVWGIIGEDARAATAFPSVVLRADKRVHAGRLAPDGKLGEIKSVEPYGDGNALETWADQQQGSILVATLGSSTYEQLLEALNAAAYRCTPDAECNTLRSQPVYMGTCR